MYKVDLHTHTDASPDGGITKRQVENLLETKLDVIAITDHHTTDMAVQLHKKHGNKIIVGQEITSIEGDIIGLYLKETIPSGLPAKKVIKFIHGQGGLVYIPHPFDWFQHRGLGEDLMNNLADQIDIIEVQNARSLTPGSARKAANFARRHKLAMAASSDGHGVAGVARGYSILTEIPTRNTLLELLDSATYVNRGASFKSVLEPHRNRRRKRDKINS